MHGIPLQSTRQYQMVAQALAFIQDHADRQPSLEDIATAMHLSPFHLQRVFAEWSGISPKRFLQFLTKEYARQQLLASASVLAVSESTGLSSTSRLHELMVTCEAMTPGEIQSGGHGLQISFGVGASPFGQALVAWTPRGVCHVAFVVQDAAALRADLFARWPGASFDHAPEQAAALLARIFPAVPTRGTLHLVLRGTNFQIKVWEALIRTDLGQVLSYRQLARQAGCPGAARAVGNALAANQIGYLIPCHRVIRETGTSGHYRWGASRKLAMLGWESGKAEQARPGGSRAPADGRRG